MSLTFDNDILKDFSVTDDSVKLYLKEIGKISLLTPFEELELAKQVLKGGKD